MRRWRLWFLALSNAPRLLCRKNESFPFSSNRRISDKSDRKSTVSTSPLLHKVCVVYSAGEEPRRGQSCVPSNQHPFESRDRAGPGRAGSSSRGAASSRSARAGPPRLCFVDSALLNVAWPTRFPWTTIALLILSAFSPFTVTKEIKLVVLFTLSPTKKQIRIFFTVLVVK